MYETAGPEETVKHLREALREGHLRAEDFSLRELAEATVGPEWVKQMDPRSGGGVRLLEAGDGVDVTAFSNITGQIVYSTILEAYQQEAVRTSRSWSTPFPRGSTARRFPASAASSTKRRRCGRACPIPAWAWARTTSRRRPPPSAASSCR